MEPPRSDETEQRLVSRAVRLPAPDARALLDSLDAPRTFWDAPDEPTVVAGGAAATLTANGPDRFASIRDGAELLLSSDEIRTDGEPARPRLFGGFAFHHDGNGTALRDESTDESPWSAFPGGRFVLPRVQVTYPDGDASGSSDSGASDDAWLTVNAVGPDATPDAVETRLERERERIASLPDPGPVADPPGVESRTRTMTRTDWRDGVAAAIERIRSGELRKVVLAQALRTRLSRPLSLPDVLTRLGESYPECFRFLADPSPDGDDLGVGFFGASPERLLSVHGRTVETGALAGTTGRGETTAEDEWLAEELRESRKNVHEHELVVDAIRDQLAPYAASVATGDRTVRRLATVQHLFTPITAELAEDEHVLTLVEALHPTPAVGGLPPEQALETIRETEPFDRGWYAAPMGWIDAAGNGTFAVALRSAVASGDTATLFAGVGIVADSDPGREWDEVQLKYRPILDELEAE